MDTIDSMVQELIEYLRPRKDDYESLMVSAINIATEQWGYANHEVGVDDKELRRIKRLATADAEIQMSKAMLEERIKAKKTYAKRLGIALDRLVRMYEQEFNI